VAPAANVEEGVQDRRCKPNVEPLEARWTPTWTPSPPHCRSPSTSCCSAPAPGPWRPTVGITPKLTDAELVCLAVLQALLGFCSEARWLRYADRHLRHLFPYLPKQPGYNKRLRRAANLLRQVIGVLAADTSWWTDDVWVADSTPVECGRSRAATKRSALAGWAA
jgi:hypothetical protein